MKAKYNNVFHLAAGILAFPLLVLSSAHASPLYWDPAGSQTQNQGGNGIWDSSASSWWTGSGSYAWQADALTGFDSIQFGGAGQAAPYLMDLALSEITALQGGGRYDVSFAFSGDYIITASNPAGTDIRMSGGNPRLLVTAETGKSVTFDGPNYGIRFIGESDDATIGSFALKFSGGGDFLLKNSILIQNTHGWGSIGIGDVNDASITTVNLGEGGVVLRGTRLYVDNAVVNVAGGLIEITGNTTNNSAKSSALQIGSLSKTDNTTASKININSGTVVALGMGGANIRGVQFNEAADGSGGSLALNGGLLITTNLDGLNRNARLVFNGGTLAASGTMYNASQADWFMTGFASSATTGIIIEEGGAFIDTSAVTLNNRLIRIRSVVSGSGNFTKLGENTLAFQVANTYTGTTTVAGGTLQLVVANGIAQSQAVRLEAGTVLNSTNLAQTFKNLGGAGTLLMGSGNLTVNSTVDTVFSGSITGSGNLAKTGDGKLTLTAPKGYAGGITVNAGALQGNADSLVGNISNSGTLIFDQNVDASYQGVITGDGALVKTGSAKLTLTSAQSYAGGLTVAAGALQGNTQSIYGNVANSGTLIFDQGVDATYEGVITGTGALEKIGAGKLTLMSAQGFTGAIVIKAGSLQGDAGSLLGNIENAGTVIFNQAADGNYAGTISGTGSLQKTGIGTLTLQNASTHSGLTDIKQGAVKLTGANALAGSSAVSLAAGTLLDFNNTKQTIRNLGGAGSMAMGTGSLIADVGADKSVVFSGSILASGGGITKTGRGSLTLGGANTFSGDISINEGAFLIGNTDARFTGNITVTDGVTFGGAGTLSAAGKTVTVGANTVIQVGTDGSLSAQTLIFDGNLIITGSSVLEVDLFSNNQSDQLMVMGNLAVSGSNRINVNTFTSGSFNIGNIGAYYDDANNPLITIRGQSVSSNSRQNVDASTDSNGNLWLITRSDISRIATWTGSNGLMWDTGASNWTGSGSSGLFASGDRVIFDSVSDTGFENNRAITIEGVNVTVSDMYVSGTGNYTFSGASITTDKDSVSAGAGSITDATGKLIKTGSGTLTLKNAGINNFKGGVDIYAGKLVLGSSGAVGASDISILGEGITLEASAENIVMDGSMNTGLFDVTYDDNGFDSTLNGEITGEGGIIKTGSGTLTLGASSSYQGATLISEGGIKTEASMAFAQSGTVTVAGGAALNLNGHSQIARNLTGAGQINLGGEADMQLVIQSDVDTEFSGIIGGDGIVSKTGTGTFIITGDIIHTGATGILEGVVKIGKANALASSGTVYVASGAMLDFDNNDQTLRNIAGSGTIMTGNATMTASTDADTTFGGHIAGEGSVVLSGTGVLTLAGDSSYTGGTTISSERVVAMSNKAFGSGTIMLAPASTLELFGVSGEVGNSIIGGGTLEVNDSGLVKLSNANILQKLNVRGAGTILSAAHVDALSGASNAAVSITEGATLEVAVRGLRGGDITISGGVLLFGIDENGQPYEGFTVNTLKFANLTRIEFGGPLITGEYTLVSGAITGVRGVDYIYDPSQYGMQIIIENNKLIAYNRSIDPSKDVAFAFDSMIASMSAVYGRMSEAFLLPLVQRSPRDKEMNFWLKAIGTYADYETDEKQIGHKDQSYGGLFGYDVISRNQHWLGGLYLGAAKNKIDTVTKATVDGDQQFAGVYGSGRLGKAYIGVDAGGGWIRSKTSRKEGLGEAFGTYGIDYMTASAELGFVLPLWEGGGIRPAAALHYMDVQFKNYKEHGAGAVKIEDFSQNVLQTFVSLQANQSFKMPWGWESMANISLGWRQTVKGNGSRVEGSLAGDQYTTFELNTKGYVRGSNVIGIGIRSAVTRDVVWSAGYDFEVTSGRTRHTMHTGIRWMWR